MERESVNEGKKQMNIWVDAEKHRIWKASGMTAAATFNFGLERNDLLMNIKILTEEKNKLQIALDRVQNELRRATDDEYFQKVKKINEILQEENLRLRQQLDSYKQ